MNQPVEILLVEDNEGDAHLTLQALASAKVRNRVSVAEDGVEAMELLRREGRYQDAPRPDVILLDLNLPRMDGRDVLLELKKDPSLKTIPVVVITTSSAEEDVLKSYALQAACYVTKPVDLKQFLHVVQSIGGKRTAEPRGHRVISSTVASELRDMLRGVLADGGTASGAAIPGYDLSGKTGTANIAINGNYSDSAYVASFIGFVPPSKPSLLVAVVVDQPHGSIYGGSVAAPAFQKIVGWAVPYFGIDPR